MPFFSSFTGSFAAGRRIPISIGGGGGGSFSDFSSTTLTYTLDNPNPYSTSDTDQFGYVVAISTNYAIVTAPAEDEPPTIGQSGKAYIYDLSDGSLLYTLDNPNAYDTSAGDRFGISVSINDSYAIVGAYLEDEAAGTSSGKAYIFDLSDGSLVNTLDNPNAYGTVTGDYFGIAVAMGSEYIIVGARDEDDAAGTDSGKAYVYKGALTGGGGGGGAIQSATSLSGTAQIYGYFGSEQQKAIYLDPTGTRFTQLINGTLYEWIMSPALDFSDLQTGSETNTTTLTNQGAYMFEDSGNLMFSYVAGSFDTITKWSLSTAYDTSTLSSSQTGSLNSSTRNTVGLKFYNNGSNLVVMDDYFSGFRGYDYYTLSTPYDLSTMSSATTKIYPGTSDSGHPLYGRSSNAGVFNNDGSRLYLTGDYKRIMVVELGTAYEIDSATSYVDYDYTSTVDDFGLGLAINATNDKLYLYLRDFIIELALG